MTNSIKLGTLATSATVRHPVILANSAKSLAHLSGGRFFLCLGAGSGDDGEYSPHGFPFTSKKERLDVYAEIVEILRGLSETSSGRGFSFRGSYFNLRESVVNVVPGTFPEIWVAERNSSRLLRVAGKFADAVNFHCISPQDAQRKLALVGGFAREAGRNTGSVRGIPKHFVIMGTDEESVASKLGYDQSKQKNESISDFVERQRKENPDAMIGLPDAIKSEFESYVEAGFEEFSPILLPNTVNEVSEGMELFARLLVR